MLQLVELNLEMEAQYKSFLEELEKQGQAGQWLFEYKQLSFNMFVQKIKNWQLGKDLPDNWIPCSTWWLCDTKNKIVGMVSLRHELNDFLKKIGGHIGYVIRKSERRRGYGTEILRLTLEKAKALGLKRVLVTCDEDNIASAKIIEKNGGMLEDTYQENEMAVPKRRYWIRLRQGASNGNN